MMFSHLFDAAGLESSEGVVLAALWEADGATAASLAERAHVPVSVVQRLVGRLGLLGYVELTPDGIWLTDDGFRLRTEAARAFSRRVQTA